MLTMNVVEISNPPAFSPGLWRSGSVEPAWVGAATSNTQINADQLSHLLSPSPEFTLSIELPAFGAKLTGEIVDLQSTNEYTEITFTSVVDVGVSALLIIRSEASTGADDNLQIKRPPSVFKWRTTVLDLSSLLILYIRCSGLAERLGF